jgi:hypothetical protein
MAQRGRLLAVALLLAGGLGAPGRAAAGPVWDWLCGKCQRPTYSPIRYWAPTAARTRDCLVGPHIPMYPPDRHPEIPPDMGLLKYPCPPVEPGATLYTVPVAPSTSRAQYFERPAPIGPTVQPER